MTSKSIKNFGGKNLPAIIEFVPLDKEGNKTIVERLVWNFDIDINERFFMPKLYEKFKMIFKIAWRNIYRNRKRSLITITSIFAALFLIILMRALQFGFYDNIIKTVVESYSGYVEIHADGYWDNQKS